MSTASPSTTKLLLEKDPPIAWVIFNQPEKRNAVSLEMWERMPALVKEIEADPELRVVVLRGAGDRAFVSGADISQFKERRRNQADQEEYARISGHGHQALARLEKPLLAMIHGYCVGGGVAVALTADLRIAADDARFGIPAARLGLGYNWPGVEKLMALVGPSTAKEIFFTARTDFSAEDALRWGLVNRVVPKAELETFTREYARRIGENAPLTVRTAKQTVGEMLRPAADRDLGKLDRMVAECFDSQDYQEGVAAFSEKRRPRFQGR
jgi:enoyl-CoA hydratase